MMSARILLVLSFSILAIVVNSGCAPLNHTHTGLSGPGGTTSSEGNTPVPIYADVWSGVATAAATGYCLAKHPYETKTNTSGAGGFTANGYEVPTESHVGAVRRNFVFERPNEDIVRGDDSGKSQTCEQACAQFGRSYQPTMLGRALRQQTSDGSLRTSGIGEMGQLVGTDHDFYMNRKTVAGIWSRSNAWHEGDVAQADYCCCQLTSVSMP